MAKYNLDKYAAADGLGFPLNFRRGNPNPLDNSSVWASLVEAQNYAANDPIAYVGQILTVVVTAEDGTTSVKAYSIQDTDGTLKEVGSVPVGDDLTIEVVDGIIKLKGAATAEVGAQPRIKSDGSIEWIVPSTETVDGLQTAVSGLQSDVSAIQTTLGDSDSGLVKNVKDNTTNIANINTKIGTVANGKTVVEMISDAKAEATYDDTALAGRVTAIEGDYLKASDKTALESEITSAANQAKTDAITAIMGEAGIDEKYDTLKEIADWILADTTASAQLITRVTSIENDYLKGADKTELQNQISELDVYIGDLPEGAVSTTVVAYIKEAIDALKIGEYAKAADLTALATHVNTAEGKITALEEVGAEKNIIASVDESQFAIDSDRKLTLLDIAMGKITGLSDALDSKVDKVEGYTLLSPTDKTKLDALVIGESGVEISGKVNAANVEGLGDWITTNRDTVAGLFDTTSANKLNGIESGAQVNNLEVIKIAGTALPITDKAVDVPMATTEALGVVLGSTAENKVSVSADGTMEVNSVNVDKLVQDENSTLILNGGSSAN